ncbi:hypothetical protein PCANC_08089 [Puccinia coronata f. sp. avenae]|uniref:Uncharacterized protein n=1 Tax=Puccinia coronata f. sp. avenae TaxID=200324 RepID=A0A2N5V3J8_9BASI|nr:hypothetical protein PCANC_08089 [Puccinia coronata f. sp. avenae]
MVGITRKGLAKPSKVEENQTSGNTATSKNQANGNWAISTRINANSIIITF